jgi:hypothetical protein
MEFISQYQYPLIGIGILIIMGLVGYLADQKENGKIAEYKKERKAKLEEKKKLKEQQKAEKMKLQEAKKNEKLRLQEEKKNEKLRLQEEKKKQKEQQAAEKMEAPAPKEEVMVAAALEQNEPEQELEIVENTDENSSEDLFVIEEPIVEETPQEEVMYQEETVSFEPAVPVESTPESFITESGEDLSVPFAFNNTASVTTEDNSLKSESSLDFNALLEEVQAEEASLETSEEDEFLKSMNNVPKPVNTEDDDALKVFMQPTVSSVKQDDMTSDNLDEWKL